MRCKELKVGMILKPKGGGTQLVRIVGIENLYQSSSMKNALFDLESMNIKRIACVTGANVERWYEIYSDHPSVNILYGK